MKSGCVLTGAWKFRTCSNINLLLWAAKSSVTSRIFPCLDDDDDNNDDVDDDDDDNNDDVDDDDDDDDA